ncbi:MAG: hypothetical protein H6Q30_2090 [Bacteroidetes bacterium]|nr:hypothetical protein [Bacteroidota bacterium]
MSVSSDHFVRALNKPIGILAGIHATQRDITIGRPEERNASTKEDGNPGDRHSLDQTCVEEPLNCPAPNWCQGQQQA